jgi:hypothetical protein
VEDRAKLIVDYRATHELKPNHQNPRRLNRAGISGDSIS